MADEELLGEKIRVLEALLADLKTGYAGDFSGGWESRGTKLVGVCRNIVGVAKAAENVAARICDTALRPPPS